METSRLLFKKYHGRFFPMFRRLGAVVTAKRLSAASKPQDWVAEMILAGRRREPRAPAPQKPAALRESPGRRARAGLVV